CAISARWTRKKHRGRSGCGNTRRRRPSGRGSCAACGWSSERPRTKIRKAGDHDVPCEHSDTRDPDSAVEASCCGVWVPAFAGTTGEEKSLWRELPCNRALKSTGDGRYCPCSCRSLSQPLLIRLRWSCRQASTFMSSPIASAQKRLASRKQALCSSRCMLSFLAAAGTLG